MRRKNTARSVVDELANQLRGTLTAGASFEGTITVDDLDVEIAVRVRRAVPLGEVHTHRDTALELLATEGYRDHCAAYVKDRSSWRSIKGTKPCSKTVTAVVVTRITPAILRGGAEGPDRAYSFRCSCHADDHGRDARTVMATIVLSQPALKVIRAKRKSDQEAREAFERRTPEEHVAQDAIAERKPPAVVAAILAQKAAS